MEDSLLNKLMNEITKYEIKEEGHKMSHFLCVYKHSCLAINEHHEYINENQKLCIMVASLLHDMDDEKLFNTEDNYNTKTILNNLNFEKEQIELICEMINLVSCKKNKSSDVNEKWKLIPRDSDRLESIGVIGLLRASIYNDTVNRPLFNDIDSIPKNRNELISKIDVNRYSNYNGTSNSLLGHFFDKIIHIGSINNLKSQNFYILGVAAKRNEIMYNIILNDLHRFENNNDLKNFLLSKLVYDKIDNI